jgi:hypothetical protein
MWELKHISGEILIRKLHPSEKENYNVKYIMFVHRRDTLFLTIKLALNRHAGYHKNGIIRKVMISMIHSLASFPLENAPQEDKLGGFVLWALRSVDGS